jgi:hypothetical protein
MTPEQRQEVVRLLQQGEELSPEWARILFPPEKRATDTGLLADLAAAAGVR